MVISDVVQLLWRQVIEVISPALIAKPVFAQKIQEEYHAGDTAHPNQSKADPESSRVCRSLWREIDVARNQATTVAKPDLHGRCYRLLVMTAHVVAEPSHQHRLRHVPPASDRIDSKIPSSDRDRRLEKKNDIPDGRDHAPADREGEAVSKPITYYGGAESDYRCNHIDWDAHRLRMN